MSRPQVSIDRVAPRRAMSEPRESMNCKSCRKRKIKCNRMRPTCEACKIFQCACVYDAIPKKRGPKTDVLEALLKRVDGLEKRLQDEKRPTEDSSTAKTHDDFTPDGSTIRRDAITSHRDSITSGDAVVRFSESSSDRRSSTTIPTAYEGVEGSSTRFRQPYAPSNAVTLPDAMLEAFFARIHGKPFVILDEHATRQKHRLGQLTPTLAMAIYALTVRYVHPPGGPEGPLRRSLDYALQARKAVDMDDPSIEGLQTLLLLSMAFFAHGRGKKAYMTLSNCSAMILALDLYREASPTSNLSSTERESRRRVFWTCYMMDRFNTCGSTRPCLLSDQSILLRLPSSLSPTSRLFVEGELFNNAGPNIQFSSDTRKRGQGVTSLLIDIVRILGITSRYLAAGGVRGDSHFPWHSLSNLSKIRQELDLWAAGTQEMFVPIDSLFGHPESTSLLLSKLVYHLIHCLIYRPFLPIDLAELRGTGQHQSWQIEATNLCFSHANAVAELVEFGRNSPLIEWPAFVSYCVCTAGTVHIHGVHYRGQEGEVFSSSAEFLAKEIQQLSWLRHCWAGVQHQPELLQTLYTCHAELVRTVASSTVRFSPVFHLEDFFDRYPGLTVDGSHVRLVDTGSDFGNDSVTAHNPFDTHHIYTNQAMNAPPLFPATRFDQPEQDRFSQPSATELGKREHDLHGGDANLLRSTSTFHFSQLPATFASPGIGTNFPSSPSAFLPSGAGLESPRVRNTSVFSSTYSPSSGGFMSEAALLLHHHHMGPTPPSNPQYATFPFDAGDPQTTTNASSSSSSRFDPTTIITAQTPGAQSQASGSHATTAAGSDTPSEKDPFLSLLEQLAENEHSHRGPSELDFFLSGSSATADLAVPPPADTDAEVVIPDTDARG